MEARDPEPWAETPSELRRALIEIADLRIENQALHEHLHTLRSRVKELSAAGGELDRDLNDL
jgi:hypothetical protein